MGKKLEKWQKLRNLLENINTLSYQCLGGES